MAANVDIVIIDRTGEVLKILPPFTDLEVSGMGVGDAEQFLVGRDGNWSWENLEFSTMHPVDFFRVYRGVPVASFDCIHATAGTTWVDGDLTSLGDGELLAYLVTAVADGEESSAGDPPRVLLNPCPAP